MCEEQNCGGKKLASGRCAKHYHQWRKTINPPCKERGCSRPVATVKSGLCGMHYERKKRGSEMAAPDRQQQSINGGFNGTERLCSQCDESKHYSRFYENMAVCMACWRGRDKEIVRTKSREVPLAYVEYRQKVQEELMQNLAL